MARKKALLLWQLYEGRCGICGECINPGVKGWDGLTIDEIIPRSKGGRKHLDNQQPAHSRCNFEKGDRYQPPVLYPDRSRILRNKLGEARFSALEPTAVISTAEPPTKFYRVAMRCPNCCYYLEYNGQLYRCGYRKPCGYFGTNPLVW